MTPSIRCAAHKTGCFGSLDPRPIHGNLSSLVETRPRLKRWALELWLPVLVVSGEVVALRVASWVVVWRILVALRAGLGWLHSHDEEEDEDAAGNQHGRVQVTHHVEVALESSGLTAFIDGEGSCKDEPHEGGCRKVEKKPLGAEASVAEPTGEHAQLWQEQQNAGDQTDGRTEQLVLNRRIRADRKHDAVEHACHQPDEHNEQLEVPVFAASGATSEVDEVAKPRLDCLSEGHRLNKGHASSLGSQLALARRETAAFENRPNARDVILDGIDEGFDGLELEGWSNEFDELHGDVEVIEIEVVAI